LQEDFGEALDELRLATGQADSARRRIAQLGMGVSSATLGGDRIERLDRACVAALRLGLYSAVGVVDDEDLSLSGSTRPEAHVELGGILCRLLVERKPVLIAEVPGAAARALPLTTTTHSTSCGGSGTSRSVIANGNRQSWWPSPPMNCSTSFCPRPRQSQTSG
jgi:hypothetical protein